MVVPTIVSFVGPSAVGLGRICDPINYNPPGHFFEFVSRVFKHVGARVLQIRDPIKTLNTSLLYTGSNRQLVSNPREHSKLVGDCLSYSMGDGFWSTTLATTRLAMGSEYKDTFQNTFLRSMWKRTKASTGGEQSLEYDWL